MLNPLVATEVKVSNPIYVPAAKPPAVTEGATDKKIKKIGAEVILETGTDASKKKISCKQWFQGTFIPSIKKIIKEILGCFKDVFCGCDDLNDSDEIDNEYGDDDEISSESLEEELKKEDPFSGLEELLKDVYQGKIPGELVEDLEKVSMGTTSKWIADFYTNDILHQEQIVKLCARAQKLAVKLNEIENPAEDFEVKGQTNLGNSCYMNSVLQALEATFGRKVPACVALAKQNLSLGEDETLRQLEDRLLHSFAPIPALDEKQKGDIPARITKDLEALEKLQGRTKEIIKKRNNLKGSIVYNNRQLTESSDRILFKWSYFLLLQAKMKGTKEDIDEALRLHHSICFSLGQHSEFKAGTSKQQKCAAAYLEFWYQMMGITFGVTTKRMTKYEGVLLSTKPVEGVQTILQIPILSKEEMKKEKMPFQLESWIGRQFRTKMRRDNGGLDGPVEFTLPNGKVENVPVYDEISKISTNPPQVLNLHIKRFFMNEKNNSQKDETPIPHAHEAKRVDFTPFFKPEVLKGENAIYDLSALVCHEGKKLTGGHYISYVKVNGNWFKCNDGKKDQVAEGKVEFDKAYLMTFTRVQPGE